MGSEISVQRVGRNQGGMVDQRHSLMSNVPPIVFHHIHGENIKLSKNSTVASRVDGFCHGITFSNRPVFINEYVYIKFLETSASWSGTIRIGFTANDPLSFRSGLPRYACPDLTKKPGNWAKALSESYVKEDSILFFYVDEHGDFRYGADNEEKGIFFGGIDVFRQLWAVVDIYGNTTSIEIIGPRIQQKNCEVSQVSNINMCSLLQPHDRHEMSFAAFGDKNLSSISFHHFHGKNVILERDRSVARRKQNTHSLGYVFTNRPLRIDEKIIVEILEVDLEYDGNLVFGVTSCDPSSLTSEELPENYDDLFDRSEYWVMDMDKVACNDGDIVICGINSEGQLTFSRYGNKPSIVLHVDSSLPLWLFFNLFGCISKIYLIGSSDHIPPFTNDIKEPKSQSDLTVSLPPLNVLPSTKGICASAVPAEDDNECTICCKETINSALYQCGHMCMCYECAMAIFKEGPCAQCPMCRNVIKDVIKIFR